MSGISFDRGVELAVNVLYVVIGLIVAVARIAVNVVQRLLELLIPLIHNLYVAALRVKLRGAKVEAESIKRFNVSKEWKIRFDMLSVWAGRHAIQLLLVAVACIWAVWSISTRRDKHCRRTHVSYADGSSMSYPEYGYAQPYMENPYSRSSSSTSADLAYTESRRKSAVDPEFANICKMFSSNPRDRDLAQFMEEKFFAPNREEKQRSLEAENWLFDFREHVRQHEEHDHQRNLAAIERLNVHQYQSRRKNDLEFIDPKNTDYFKKQNGDVYKMDSSGNIKYAGHIRQDGKIDWSY